MVPILSALIMGDANRSFKNKLMLSLAYVLGMSLSYAAIGLCFAWLGANIQTQLQTPWAIGFFSLLFILMAGGLFDWYQLSLPSALQQRIDRASRAQHAGRFVGVLMMGVLSVLILSPCVTPALVSALALISQKGQLLEGAFSLFMMGLGIGLPLLILVLFGSRYLPKSGSWMTRIKHGLGFLLLLFAILNLNRIITGPAILFGISAWALMIVIYCFYRSKQQTSKGKWLWALPWLVIAVLYGYWGVQQHQNPLKPWQSPKSSHQSTLLFTPITNVKTLNDYLKTSKQPILVLYTASWCLACQEMEQFAFTNPAVKALLADWTRLKVDISHQNAATRQLKQRFAVIAPPTLVLYRRIAGTEQHQVLIGEQAPKALINAIHAWQSDQTTSDNH